MTEEAIALFQEVAGMEPSSRAAFYSARNIPQSLRDEVELLLPFDTFSGTFSDVVAHSAADVLDARQGAQCGPYRLIRLLGEGGMGAVFLAERADGEVEQQVAIKLVRAGHSQIILQRFLQERSILALLRHPGIAHLLDAGHTEDGQPYLAMDYVDGTPIDEYCGNLEIPQILELFLEVCDAVSYAHRNLVIHRDLKPSNILIDKSGRPRLLDFGIAKILDSGDEGQTVIRALTPEYASPEQARGEARTTATDVYSLGAVLRKLLRETKVPKDVQAIIAKAMRAEPEKRYAGVEAMSADIRAFLRHLPVEARSGNAWYYIQRFLRRYWIPSAAAALAISGLSVGLYIANHERAIAQTRFRQVRELAGEFIAVDKDVRDLPGVTRARNRIVSTALKYLAALGPDARGDKDLSYEIANAYVQVAHAQGVPVNSNLGRLDESRKSLENASQFIGAVLKAAPSDRRALLLAATIAHDSMIVAQTQGDTAEAISDAQKAEEQLDRLVALGQGDENEHREVAYMYGNVAETFSDDRRYEDSIRSANRAIEAAQTITSKNQAMGNRALALGVIALSRRELGDLDGALEAVQQSRRLQESMATGGLTWQQFNLALALQREASILGEPGKKNLGRDAEAIETYRRAVAIAAAGADRDPNDSAYRVLLAQLSRSLAGLVGSKDPAQALALCNTALARLGEVKVRNPEIQRERDELRVASSRYGAASRGER
jgi:tRNA A-37 threonylcarbamoyl transferase component Bud32/tetratricopeptide (TPR) repeat protein